MAFNRLSAFVQVEDDSWHGPKSSVVNVENREHNYETQSRLREPEPAVVEALNASHATWQPPAEWTSTPTYLQSEEPPRVSTDRSVTVSQTWKNPSMNKWRILTACIIQFGNGFNDSAPGALLPYIEKYYSIDYSTVSTIFISNAVGFLTAAFFVHLMDTRLGRAKTIAICEGIVAIGYAVMIAPPPFPLIPIGYFFTGFGVATGLALNNVFIANLAHSTIILGIFHGGYGLGGIAGPLISTLMVSHGVLFSRVWGIMFGFRVLNFILAALSFTRFEQDNASHAREEIPMTTHEEREDNVASSFSESSQTGTKSLLSALSNRTTLIGALFIFAYQGAEVTMSGWVISFLITTRHGDPSRVGFVTSGFWGGITVGRFLLSFLGAKYGEKRLVFILTILSIGFQLILWFSPDIISDAIAIAIIGLLQGPVYPCATVIFSKLLPRKLQNTSIAFISSAGSSGGAVWPFMTGLLAQSAGTWVLNPICVTLFTVMTACWFSLPNIRKPRE